MADKEIRILFTSVGRRVELMQAFRDAAWRTGCFLRIYGADLSATAPALFYCDETRIPPRITDPGYIDALLAMCAEDHIDVLLPTIDTDLLLLSENRERFEAIGTRVLISDPSFIGICRDKRKTAEFFTGRGFFAPEVCESPEDYHGGFPCFIKPLDGSSSINTHRCETMEELRDAAVLVPKPIIQPFIEGDEYTVDVLLGFDGRPLSVIPRRRYAVRSGEVMKTRVVMDDRIIRDCTRMLEGSGAAGPLTIQLIRRRNGEAADQIEDYYIEINPRYGGGAPLSMRAGADTAAMLLCDLMGREPLPQRSMDEEGIYVRFDQSIRVGKEPVEAASLKDVSDLSDRYRGIVFDLDDTLYAEYDYVMSGFRAVADAGLLDCDSDALFQELRETFEEEVRSAGLGRARTIDHVFARRGCSDREIIDRALRIYRTQEPKITLFPEAAQLLAALQERRRAGECSLGLITDGRPDGQRAKIRALGLEEYFDEIIVTDGLAGKSSNVARFRKPGEIAFLLMAMRLSLPHGEMVYVGDNPAKDFAAPLRLGMDAVWVHRPDALRNRFRGGDTHL